MSEILHSQWPCPYCPQLFSTSTDLRNHLNDRLPKILEEIQRLLQQSCSLLPGKVLERGGIDQSPIQSLESLTEVLAADPLDLTCPHKECDDKEKTAYTKKTNLLRHYQSHIACSAKCPFCSTTFKSLRKLVKHCERCKPKKRGLEDKEAVRVKRDLCLLASDALDRQLDARAASLHISRREEGNGEIYGQPSRPPKRRRTEADATENSDGSSSTSPPQSEFETDRCEQVQPGHEQHLVNNIGTTQLLSEGKSTTDLMQQVKDYAINLDTWAESVFGEDLVPIHPEGWTAPVFAANIPVHPDLWSQTVFIDGLGVAQMGTTCQF